jgi:hypothetical protein
MEHQSETLAKAHASGLSPCETVVQEHASEDVAISMPTYRRA